MTDEPRDIEYWATNVARLHVGEDRRDVGYNIEGRRVAGPQQGFGRLWQRTSIATLGDAATPQQVVANWRANFGSYWPSIARFHGSLTGISPGDVDPLETGPVATGILVLYADETSFTFITPMGHQFAGLITFSAEAGTGGTQAKIDILLRTADPLIEAAWFYIRPSEDRFWADTLQNLAGAFGVDDVTVEQTTVCVDSKRIWRNWTNIAHSSVFGTAWQVSTSALRRKSPRRAS